VICVDILPGFPGMGCQTKVGWSKMVFFVLFVSTSWELLGQGQNLSFAEWSFNWAINKMQ